ALGWTIQFLLLAILLCLPQSAATASELTVFPTEIQLTTAPDRQSVVVQLHQPDGVTRDVTPEATLTVADPSVASLAGVNFAPRLNLAIPEESLLLEKSLGLVTHTGGERFKKDSASYRTLLRWIQEGAGKDPADVAAVVAVEIAPDKMVLAGSNSTQQLCVRARYSDGTDRDVTSLGVFFSNNDPVARVS